MTRWIKNEDGSIKSGIATVSVVAGQVYVGTGYREMANEIKTTRIAVSNKVEELTSWMPWVNWD